MALAAGQRLGHYEIVGPLGVGGMGEVYRATDTSLKRDVAIKILPGAFASDPERLARFEREAQVLAQLHHPNIASIFGLHDEGGVRFLAMELVPGETLEERIARGRIPLEETVTIAKKIADGLEYAHERNIVHRDLKPANIKITADGDVKILDFGLAKAITGEVMSAGPTSTPTIVPTMTSVGTAIGIILGTAAYMSPEQARGRPVDKRADIWAFGAVVYEMLTGKRLFDGETVSDTIAAVLTRPLELEGLTGVPASYRRLLARCLERDPKLRLRDIGEARIALDGPPSAPPERAAAPAAPRRPALLIAAIPLAALVGIGAGWLLRTPPPAKLDDARYALAIPSGMTLLTTEQVQIAASRDGKLQVAVAVDTDSISHLIIRSEQEFEPRVLPDTERAKGPIISPDGAWIAFFRDGALFKIPLAGGPPVRLTAACPQPRGVAWSTDGNIYLTADVVTPLMRVSENGGTLDPVTRLDEARNERTHRWPDVLPDGSAVLYTSDDAASTEYYDDARIEVIRPATKEHKVVMEGASMARFAPGGRLVFARGGSLYAVHFDAKTLTVSGVPTQIAQAVATDVGTGATNFALDGQGGIVLIPGEQVATRRPVWVDRQGIETSGSVPPAPYNELALSPDGTRVALTGGRGGVSDVWVYEFARGTMTRLTNGEFASHPTWSPDGTQVAYGIRPQGVKAKSNLWQIAIKPADGSRDAVELLERPRRQLPSSFTPDGKQLVFDCGHDEQPTRTSVCVMPVTAKAEPSELIAGASDTSAGVISPDGRWIAYVSADAGQSAVFVRPFPQGQGRWQISPGTEPRWAPDGRSLFFRDNGELHIAPIDTSHGFSPGRPERICDHVAFGGNISTYGVAPDGRKAFIFRGPQGQGSERTIYLDRGFGRRL